MLLYVPLVDREAEMHAMFDLASLGAAHVMTASDVDRREVWATVLARQAQGPLQDEIRADFAQAVGALARPLPAAPLVLALLTETPSVTDVHATMAKALGHPDPKSEAARRCVWKRLRRAGQMPASRLLVLFRLLWYARLAAAGWVPGAIASFLGFRSPRQLRLTFRRRLELPIRQLHALTYDDLVRWTARACVMGVEMLGRPAEVQAGDAFAGHNK
ncbi:MAG TPA: hypothetical protein VHM30_01675 [Gemmatimonadaceae bacterium]|nr:hypothetical protein [Gemmatimonadaceae bacterium]